MNAQPEEINNAQKPEKRTSLFRMTWQNVQIALGLGLIMATLFTAWTPGEAPQEPATWEISEIRRLPTPLPTPGPTATARLTPFIGIVAGHWGNDSGSVCNDGLTEAEVNQTIASIAQKKLSDLGYDVELLKEFDPRLLNYRATVLVSVHADSCLYINSEATGFKVAAALANPNPEKATRLTSCLRARYGQVSGLPMHSTSVTVDMTDYHAFSEIDESTVAAIIETGFLNLDREFLTGSPDVAAQGIVNGILCYMNNESLTSPTNPPSP